MTRKSLILDDLRHVADPGTVKVRQNLENAHQKVVDDATCEEHSYENTEVYAQAKERECWCVSSHSSKSTTRCLQRHEDETFESRNSFSTSEREKCMGGWE